MNEEEMTYNYKMVRIGHKNHELQTQTTMQKSLSPFNYKNWIHKNGQEFQTQSFGHKGITTKLINKHIAHS